MLGTRISDFGLRISNLENRKQETGDRQQATGDGRAGPELAEGSVSRVDDSDPLPLPGREEILVPCHEREPTDDGSAKQPTVDPETANAPTTLFRFGFQPVSAAVVPSTAAA